MIVVGLSEEPTSDTEAQVATAVEDSLVGYGDIQSVEVTYVEVLNSDTGRRLLQSDGVDIFVEFIVYTAEEDAAAVTQGITDAVDDGSVTENLQEHSCCSVATAGWDYSGDKKGEFPTVTYNADASVDCQISDWSSWSDCDPTTNTQERSRTKLEPVGDGDPCEEVDLQQVRTCPGGSDGGLDDGIIALIVIICVLVVCGVVGGIIYTRKQKPDGGRPAPVPAAEEVLPVPVPRDEPVAAEAKQESVAVEAKQEPIAAEAEPEPVAAEAKQEPVVASADDEAAPAAAAEGEQEKNDPDPEPVALNDVEPVLEVLPESQPEAVVKYHNDMEENSSENSDSTTDEESNGDVVRFHI